MLGGWSLVARERPQTRARLRGLISATATCPSMSAAQRGTEVPFANSCFMRRLFADLATAVAYQSGRPATFLIAAIIILFWAITGPIFHYSDTWQLIINTGTTIVTFLMVFVIQN